MGTKTNPSEFNCYAKAREDEPVFVLLGRDPVAAEVVAFWAALRIRTFLNSEQDIQIEEALRVAETMKNYAMSNLKGAQVQLAKKMARRLMGARTWLQRLFG